MSDERDQEELEGRIRELEATVESLTSELVDATERIRELEAELDLDGETTSDDSTEQTPESWVPAAEDVDEGASSSTRSAATDETEETGDDTTTRSSDDIIVA
jgi:predicted  nucleic acid-binding Zn-ribbon protein